MVCTKQHIGTHLPPMLCHLVTRLGCIIGLLSAAALPVAGYPAFLVLQSSISPTDARDSCWRNRNRRNSIAAWVTMRAHMYSTASLTTPGPRGIIDSSDVLLHQTPYASLCSYHPLLTLPTFVLCSDIFVSRATSDGPSVRSIPSSSFRLPNDLHNLTSPQTQIPRHRIVHSDSRQLCLLQSVSLKQTTLLLLTQRNVLGHQLVLGDVDEQIFLPEDFHDRR